jgi:rubredoxin
MRHAYRFKINYTGGIISPGSLLTLLEALDKTVIKELRFGLRQQLLIDVALKDHDHVAEVLHAHDIFFEVNKDEFPNILSSYPAEGIFIRDSWVREGVYKDIFDGMDFKPTLKINISDEGQTFTPFFTGNINWIASNDPQFWYLYIRFPKTNVLFPSMELYYTNEIPRLSKQLEKMILKQTESRSIGDRQDGHYIFENLKTEFNILSKPVSRPLTLPKFKLPYYEGFNGYGNKSWLGLYQRNEVFSVAFLKDICRICLDTKVGQLYCTPWKSLIIKNIEEQHQQRWSNILDKHRINVRHASNELNWQVEDNNEEGLSIKQTIIRQFDKDDIRTFGLCLAIKTQPNSGLFGSVIVRKQYATIREKLKPLDKFDILYTEDFNPNSKKLVTYRTGILKEHLAVYLISLCKLYYEQQSLISENSAPFSQKTDSGKGEKVESELHQCKYCGTVYDMEVGEPDSNIQPGTPFSSLPESYSCPLCESAKHEFILVPRSDAFSLGLP